MNFRKYSPSKQLKHLISYYWLIEDDYGTGVPDTSFPDGCIELVFSVGLEVYRSGNGDQFHREPDCEVIGQLTKPYFLKIKGKGKIFGIRFFPHTFSRIFPTSINDLNDTAIHIEHILDTGFSRFVEECLYCGNIELIIQIFEVKMCEILLQRPESSKDKIVHFAVKRIYMDEGNSNLERISKDCSITQRYLQIIFKEKVGISPKSFARIVRFQRALCLISNPDLNLTLIAYTLGYFDQAHFIREFKEFTSATPSIYESKKHPVNKHFLQENESSLLYNSLLES